MLFTNLNIKNINFNSVYLQNICKKNILLKYTCKGNKFLSLSKYEINYHNCNDVFTNFNEPMYETLTENTYSKIYLDMDFKNINEEDYKNKNDIFIKFNNIFVEFLKNNEINYRNIIYMDASRPCGNNLYKISLHIVVNGTGFKNRNILKKFIINFKNSFDKDSIYYNAIDIMPYNTPQLFKCVLSPSKDDKTLLRPIEIIEDRIIYSKLDHIFNNIFDYLVGIYKNEDIIYLDDKFEHLKNIIDNKNKLYKNKINKKIENNIVIPENTRKWVERNRFVMNIYEIRSNYIVDNKIDLQRLRPAYCRLCDRNHENENAFVKVNNNNLVFYCGRNNNGVVIGSWYNNYKKENISNNIDNNKYYELVKQNKELNNIINNLKKYIVEIEVKLDEAKSNLLKVTTDLSKNILKRNTKSENIEKKIYTKNSNSNMWNKYYLLGKSIKENINELYDEIIKNWKDKNISKIKNRGIRIFTYLEKFSTNVKNLSLRQIFHLKNYEFDKLLI